MFIKYVLEIVSNYLAFFFCDFLIFFHDNSLQTSEFLAYEATLFSKERLFFYFSPLLRYNSCLSFTYQYKYFQIFNLQKTNYIQFILLKQKQGPCLMDINPLIEFSNHIQKGGAFTVLGVNKRPRYYECFQNPYLQLNNFILIAYGIIFKSIF